MSHPIWKGEISFGLIGIEVELFSAIKTTKSSFHLVDRRNGARVRYQKVNEESGEEVPWDQVAKSYEYKAGHSLIVEKETLERFSPKLTKTVDLEQFVDLSELPLFIYKKPYYTVPSKRSQKAYVLLRETLKQQGKGGLGRVVIRSKSSLSVIFPFQNALMVNLLRYPEEIADLEEFDFPEAIDFDDKIKDKEVQLAEQLVDSLSGPWQPSKFKDSFELHFKDWLKREIKKHDGNKIPPSNTQKKKRPKPDNVINIEELLKSSLKKNNRKRSS